MLTEKEKAAAEVKSVIDNLIKKFNETEHELQPVVILARDANLLLRLIQALNEISPAGLRARLELGPQDPRSADAYAILCEFNLIAQGFTK